MEEGGEGGGDEEQFYQTYVTQVRKVHMLNLLFIYCGVVRKIKLYHIYVL